MPKVKNIPEREHADILKACLNGNPKRLAIALIASSGARANEVLKLKSADFTIKLVDSTNPVDSTIPVESVEIFVRSSKGGVSRRIPLPMVFLARAKSLKGALDQRESLTLAGLINSGSLSIDSAYELTRLEFNKIQRELWGSERYTLHGLRHTIAIKAIKSGLDIVKVKTLLGHRSINTTMIYLREYAETLALDELPSLIPVEEMK